MTYPTNPLQLSTKFAPTVVTTIAVAAIAAIKTV